MQRSSKHLTQGIVKPPDKASANLCARISRFAPNPQAWHREKPNAILVDNYDRFIGPNEPEARVLVPLCGKTVDMPYLAQRGKSVWYPLKNRQFHVCAAEEQLVP